MESDRLSTRGGIWIFDRRLRNPRSSSSSRGYWSATWPSAKLCGDREQLTISSVLIDPLVVTHQNILSITPFDWFPPLGRGLRFEVGDQDEATVFWTYRRSKIMRDLVSLGWPIGGRPR